MCGVKQRGERQNGKALFVKKQLTSSLLEVNRVNGMGPPPCSSPLTDAHLGIMEMLSCNICKSFMFSKQVDACRSS